MLLVLNLVDEQPPQLDDEDLGLLVQHHLHVLQDGGGRRPGQHLGADELRERGLELAAGR